MLWVESWEKIKNQKMVSSVCFENSEWKTKQTQGHSCCDLISGLLQSISPTLNPHPSWAPPKKARSHLFSKLLHFDQKFIGGSCANSQVYKWQSWGDSVWTQIFGAMQTFTCFMVTGENLSSDFKMIWKTSGMSNNSTILLPMWHFKGAGKPFAFLFIRF